MARPPVVLLSGVRWGFLWQRHHALATCFARAGYTTVFVETTGLANPRPSALAKVKARLLGGGAGRDVGDGLIVYSPRVLPPTLIHDSYTWGLSKTQLWLKYLWKI